MDIVQKMPKNEIDASFADYKKKLMIGDYNTMLKDNLVAMMNTGYLDFDMNLQNLQNSRNRIEYAAN